MDAAMCRLGRAVGGRSRAIGHAVRLALAVVVVILAGLALRPAQAPAKAPFGFIGMNAEDVYAGDAAYQERNLALMQAYGVTVIRQNFRWGYSEPQRGVFDWTQLDGYVLAAAQHGIRILPLLYGETEWATSRPRGNKSRCTYPPKHYADFGTWAGQVAARYGRNGTLWSLHPDLRGQAITAYEIWNEPNFKSFWKCKPNAGQYVKLARETKKGIRRSDPHAILISAGSPKIEKHPGEYLRKMMKAGAKDVFNALGLHPYQPSSDDVIRLLKDARRIIDSFGAKKWKLVVTEFGWASGGPKAKGKTVSESKQATLLKNTIIKMGKQRKKLKLASAIYYTWHDLPPAVGQSDYWGLHTGMLRKNDALKPALNALTQASNAVH